MVDTLTQLKDGVFNGVIDVTCPICKSELRCEPDGDTVWCEICNKIVRPKDSLVAKGLI